jgi:hypothetical protein
VEGGEAELQASSEEAGAARNGEAKRRPWRELGLWEVSRKSEQEEEEERGKKGGLRGAGEGLQVVFSAFVGKQEVAAQVTWEPPRRSLARGGRNKRENL